MAVLPSLCPGYGRAVLAALLFTLAACSPQKSPEQSMDAAAAHLQRNETAAALIEAKNALQQNPELPRAVTCCAWA